MKANLGIGNLRLSSAMTLAQSAMAWHHYVCGSLQLDRTISNDASDLVRLLRRLCIPALRFPNYIARVRQNLVL